MGRPCPRVILTEGANTVPGVVRRGAGVKNKDIKIHPGWSRMSPAPALWIERSKESHRTWPHTMIVDQGYQQENETSACEVRLVKYQYQ